MRFPAALPRSFQTRLERLVQVLASVPTDDSKRHRSHKRRERDEHDTDERAKTKMGKMDELDAAIDEMTKKLEKFDDKDKVQELRESMKMVKQQAEDDPEKIDELIASMKMMSTSIDDPSAMFAGMGGGGGGQPVEIVNHIAETNAAIREAMKTNDIDTLERVLKERAEHKSQMYFKAEETLMSWKQKRCKDALNKAIQELDVETLEAELEIAARPDVFLTGTNEKGEPFADIVVICAREELEGAKAGVSMQMAGEEGEEEEEEEEVDEAGGSMHVAGEEEEIDEGEEEKKKDGFVASTAKKEAKKQKGFVEKLIRRDLAKVI